MLRSVAGVVGGAVAACLLSAMANAVVLHGALAPRMPAHSLSALLLLMHGLAAVAGGYVAGRVAGRRSGAHGLAVGALLVLAGQLGPGAVRAVVHPVLSEPLWFSAGASLLVLLGGWIGGLARDQVVHRGGRGVRTPGS